MNSPERFYDYIIVGGGTAGCVVATRLTEDPKISVLLLEAGSDNVDDHRIRVPLNMTAAMGSPEVDWCYKTVPQTNALKGYKDNVCQWPRGKILGGSSSINGMCWVRGHRDDYDSWARQGCDGWDWDNVEKYFRKSENFITEKPGTKASTRCAIDITDHPFSRTDTAQEFLKAGVELGYDEVDINSGNNVGFGHFPASIDYNGERSSTATGYLRRAIDRTNLKVITKVLVEKIIFEGTAARGVTVQEDGMQNHYYANKEIILCGGAINSPQILMLSGAGPKDHLADMGIECIADLPVGRNLQDHLQLQVKADVKPGSDVYTGERVKTNTNTSEVTGFIRTPLWLQGTNDWPDCQIYCKALFYQAGVLAPKVFPLKDRRFWPYMGFDQPIGDYVRREGFTVQIIPLHPRSVGELRLKDKDPLSHPVIDPRYLEDQRDVDVMVEGILVAQKILNRTEAMRPFEMKIINLKMPGNSYDEWSHENLSEFARHFAWTIFHPVGTCRMGDAKDSATVVTPDLRVRGLGNLRVIDASIMPHLTSGNTVAPVIMIAEKGADMIKRDFHTNSSKL